MTNDNNNSFNKSQPENVNKIFVDETKQLQADSKFIELPANEDSKNKIKLPDNKSQLKHIFRDKEGHLPDTPENRKLLEDLANDNTKNLGTDSLGHSWNAEKFKDNSQLWVEYSDNKIINGGKNNTPRKWNHKTGLKNPHKPTQKKPKCKQEIKVMPPINSINLQA